MSIYVYRILNGYISSLPRTILVNKVKKLNKIPLLLLIVLALIMVSAAASLSATLEPRDTEVLLVRFKPGVSKDFQRMLLSELGARIIDEIPQIDVLMVEVAQRSLLKIERFLIQYSFMLDFVERDYLLQSSLVPDDTYYSLEWHLRKIGAPEAWDISIGESGVIVAVLDSGIDPSHPDLLNKLVKGYNFYDNNYDTSDVYGHGTKVAGVVAAATNNGMGVASIGWNVSIMPIRVTDTNGYALVSLLTKGLIYAADQGAKVAVISFQIYGGSSLTSAAKYFFERGGLVFAAGGNSGSYVGDPENPYIISVSATTDTDARASFSTYGPFIDISAPGVNIYTTIKGGGYGSVSGTSFSAPLAAGVAALMFSANPSLTPSDVEAILKATSVDLGDSGYDIYYGWGRIDASAALRAVASTTPPSNIDLNPPVVTIKYPSNGDTISGVVNVKVDASDDTSVSKVELYVNGNLFATDSDPPYEFCWDTKSYADGAYTLIARAYDPSNNIGESAEVRVNVSKPPVGPVTINILSPSNGSTVSGRIYIWVSASSSSSIKTIQIYIDGKLIATARNKSTYRYLWNTRRYSNRLHTIKIRVCDSLGNVAETSIVVYIRN